MNIITLILTFIFLIYEISVLINPKKYWLITKEALLLKSDTEEFLNHLKRNISYYRVTILYWLYSFYGFFTPQYKYFFIILLVVIIKAFFEKKYFITFYIDPIITICILSLITKNILL